MSSVCSWSITRGPYGSFFCVTLFLSVFYLYSLPYEPFVYIGVLINVVLLIIGILNFTVIYKRHKELNHLKESILLTGFTFPESKNIMEQDFKYCYGIVHDDRIRVIIQSRHPLPLWLGFAIREKRYECRNVGAVISHWAICWIDIAVS